MVNIAFSFFLLLLVLFKPVLLLLSSPIIHIYCILRLRKRKERQKEGEICALPEVTLDNHNSISIKTKLMNFADGYYRLYIHWVSFIPSHHLRNFIYKHCLMVRIGEGSIIYYGADFRATYLLNIGSHSIIGDKCTIDARVNGVTIGDNVNISSNVSMWTDQHDYNDPWFRSLPGKRGAITIKDRAWIGPNVTILHSVTIGEGAVVAAGSVVTKNVEPYTLVGGIPAKKIGERNKELKYTLGKGHLCFL